jgi:hypothetical protein
MHRRLARLPRSRAGRRFFKAVDVTIAEVRDVPLWVGGPTDLTMLPGPASSPAATSADQCLRLPPASPESVGTLR